MAAPKLHDIDKLAVKHLITKLNRRGWSQWQIRDEIKAQLGIEISQPMVGIYKRQVMQQYKDDIRRELDEDRGLKLDQYRDILREAWDAYDRSNNDAITEREEFADDSEAVGADDFVTSEKRIKRIVTREGRLPDNGYLHTILACHKAERELLGLDAERAPTSQTNVNVEITGNQFWTGLSQQVAKALPTVERKMEVLLEQGTTGSTSTSEGRSELAPASADSQQPAGTTDGADPG